MASMRPTMATRFVPPLLSLAFAAAAVAQVPQAIPYSRQMDLMVVDSDYDGVWRLMDLNQDGDYNDPGEVVSFYDDLNGPIVFTSPSCICCGLDGSVFVGDSNTDVITRLRDLNGDGDALDVGEATVYFDPANLSGVVMSSVQGVTVDLLGRLFLAVANTASGTDHILMLQDLDADGDANDLGEAEIYCLIPGGAGSAGNSIPTEVIAGPGSNLYYSEVGSTGAIAKGIYKLSDLNQNGNCNDPGEVTSFWTPPFVASPSYYGLTVDATGAFYVSDHSNNENVFRAFDADASGIIDATEQTVFYHTGGSLWWDMVAKDDLGILLCEAQAPDRITLLRDLNSDGDALDTGEATQAYDSTIATVAVAPRGMALQRAPMMSLSPAVVQVGNNVDIFVWSARPGDLAAIVMSVAPLSPTPVPPFGMLEINPLIAAVLTFGIADATGSFVATLPVPNSPTAVNSYWFQTLGGDNLRLFLSNSAMLTCTP